MFQVDARAVRWHPPFQAFPVWTTAAVRMPDSNGVDLLFRPVLADRCGVNTHGLGWCASPPPSPRTVVVQDERLSDSNRAAAMVVPVSRLKRCANERRKLIAGATRCVLVACTVIKGPAHGVKGRPRRLQAVFDAAHLDESTTVECPQVLRNAIVKDRVRETHVDLTWNM